MHLSCGLEIDQTCEMVMQEEGTGINPHVDNPRGVFRILILWVGFPTGRDSAIFRDKGTEIPSLSRDKGTTGQAQNLATGRDGIFYWLSRPGTFWDTITFNFFL